MVRPSKRREPDCWLSAIFTLYFMILRILQTVNNNKTLTIYNLMTYKLSSIMERDLLLS